MDNNINDPAFAEKAVQMLIDMIEKKRQMQGETRSTEISRSSAPVPSSSLPQKRKPNEAEVEAQACLWDSLQRKGGEGGEPTPREKALLRLLECLRAGRPIIGAGAGTGISAKFEEVGGADLIVIYNSGRFRMAGRGSLAGLMPYKDANAVVIEMAGEVLPIVKNVPVLAGVCATDPFRNMDLFLQKIKKLGFAGVQNFPTVGLIDGNFRKNLEETGMSYKVEVEMVRKARALGLLTTPYVFNVEDAKMMAQAGADVVVNHVRLNRGVHCPHPRRMCPTHSRDL